MAYCVVLIAMIPAIGNTVADERRIDALGERVSKASSFSTPTDK